MSVQDDDGPDEERVRRQIALGTLFLGGLFLDRVLSDEEVLYTKDGKKRTVRRGIIDELFGWPDEETDANATSRARLQKQKDRENAASMESTDRSQTRARPLRSPPRKNKNYRRYRPDRSY